MYNKRTWLNKDDSPSTGNVVAFEGEVLWKGKKIQSAFLSVSDCNVSARLYKTDDDTMYDFVNKMKLLRKEIDLFIKHLEKNISKNKIPIAVKRASPRVLEVYENAKEMDWIDFAKWFEKYFTEIKK